MASVQTPPSAAAIAVATAIISGLTGYYIGQARSIGVFGTSTPRDDDGISDADAASGDEADADEEADDEDDVQDLQTFPGNDEECKLVLVVRTDLGMGKGKIAAQCSHATLACYKTLLGASPSHSHPLLTRWERLGQAKVALKVDSEPDMLLLQAQALSLGLCAQVIHDAGRTQIASGSATVLGIGPAPRSVVDGVTGGLKLL